MNIAKLFIKRNVFTILTYILIAIFGFYSYNTLPLALYPSMEIPMAVVFTTYSGAGPEDIEEQVTKPLESACAGLSGLKTLESSSAENMSMIMVEFDDSVDLDEAMVDMRDSIEMVKATLPDDASDPMVMSIDVDAMPVIQVALKGQDLASLQAIAEDDLDPLLSRLDGVASIDITGGYEEEIAVKTDPAKMKGYNLTISSIAAQIGADNMTIPGGDLESGSQTLAVRTDGKYETVNDVKNALISLPTGGTIRLSQVANVAMAHKDQDAINKVDGEECVIISVNKQSGTNTVKVAEKAVAAIEEYVAGNPSLTTTLLMDQSDYINQTADNAVSNIIFGVIFAAIVLIIFLRDAGATISISLAMPACILFTFLVMNALGVTLNMMSLGGIALGVGMIVDNSIVVLDNIFRFRSDGADRWDACVKGTAEVTPSVIASTLTTVAVFLPIGLSGGMTGMMFKEFSLTIVTLIGSSLIVAITLVPLLCYMLLDRGEKRKVRIPEVKDKFVEKPTARLYKKILNLFITKRYVGIAATFGLCIVFIISIGAAGMELIPETDEGSLSVTIGMPNGSTKEDVAEISEKIVEKAVATIPELEMVYYTTGSSGSMMSALSSSGVTIQLVDLKDRNRSSKEIANQLRREIADIAGCELTVSASDSMSGMSGSAINVQLMGNDYDELTAVSNDLAEKLGKLPDAVNVKSSASEQVPRVAVKINRENASRFGLSVGSIGSLVRAELTGSVATKLSMKGEEYDVTISGDEKTSKSLDALRSMQLPLATGGTIPLSMVADVYTELSPQSISHINQNKTVTITGDTESGDTVEITTKVNELLAAYEMPEGVILDDGASAMADMMETMSTLMLALGVAVLLVYFILATQFNSFVLPISIMMILPIGLLGSMSTLAITGNKVSMVAILGVIILAGTVVNNSIVLIDYILIRRQEGEEKNVAIMNACPRRVRPVLMTTMTTVLGLIPMVFGGGEGSEMMKPMGIVMMTGMIISTIATLFITPVYYSVIDSIETRFRNRKKNKPKKKPKNKGKHLKGKKIEEVEPEE